MGKTPGTDPYETFAEVYDAWQAGYPRPFALAIYPYYEREILTRGTPERSIVDHACGTGTFLERWGREHPDWRLHGTDRSPRMLAQARRRLRLAGVRARLLAQPMPSVSIPGQTGAAVCVFDSVNHLLRISDLRGFFSRAASSLLPGGLFLFDLNDERAFPRLLSGTWVVESPGLCVLAAGRTLGRSMGEQRFTIFRRDGGTRWRRWDVKILERNWGAGEVRPVLERSGLEILRVRRIDAYPGEDVDAPRTLWICRRRITPPMTRNRRW